MKLRFLGTSAGESYPGIWCDCPNCTYARKHGGRNIRMNTGSMIDDDVLLDMNSCGFYTAARMGVTLSGVKTLLATHPHDDHNTIQPLEWRYDTENVASMPEEQQHLMSSPRFTGLAMMTVYGNRYYKETFVDTHPELFDGRMNAQMQFHQIEEGVRVEAADGLSFIPVRSRHGEPGFAHSYIIERGGKTLLYALDTGGYDDDMLDIILAHKYDCVVMEGTVGLNPTRFSGHMGLNKNREFRQMLIEKGCITAETPFILTHLCPHWTPPHDIFAPMMAEEGITVAYDGMEFDF